MIIKKKDFEAWLENPVTEVFMARLKDESNRSYDEWTAASWNDEVWASGKANEIRAACRARAECAEDFSDPDKVANEIVDDEEQERREADRVQGTDQA